jgi:hypothetical protein
MPAPCARRPGAPSCRRRIATIRGGAAMATALFVVKVSITPEQDEAFKEILVEAR